MVQLTWIHQCFYTWTNIFIWYLVHKQNSVIAVASATGM